LTHPVIASLAPLSSPAAEREDIFSYNTNQRQTDEPVCL